MPMARSCVVQQWWQAVDPGCPHPALLRTVAFSKKSGATGTVKFEFGLSLIYIFFFFIITLFSQCATWLAKSVDNKDPCSTREDNCSRGGSSTALMCTAKTLASYSPTVVVQAPPYPLGTSDFHVCGSPYQATVNN
ncbi:hypothetical protein CEXT_108741 [Caerostris extrusa]|uniref:Uncharacterized protein n=1 Tax=Caerostris extrusa TaxID=172846 RepID=A0AAV4PCD9_CAEEX|nr:hypothetical protein CEXT_108741 [Caerostris extrusa]